MNVTVTLRLRFLKGLRRSRILQKNTVDPYDNVKYGTVSSTRISRTATGRSMQQILVRCVKDDPSI